MSHKTPAQRQAQAGSQLGRLGGLGVCLVAAPLAHEGVGLGVVRLARAAAAQGGRAGAVLGGAVVLEHVLQQAQRDLEE